MTRHKKQARVDLLVHHLADGPMSRDDLAALLDIHPATIDNTVQGTKVLERDGGNIVSIALGREPVNAESTRPKGMGDLEAIVWDDLGAHGPRTLAEVAVDLGFSIGSVERMVAESHIVDHKLCRRTEQH